MATDPSTNESRGIEEYNEHLCQKCQNLARRWYELLDYCESQYRKSFKLDHHSLGSLQKSAKEGCPVCTFLYNSLDDDLLRQVQSHGGEDISFVSFYKHTASIHYSIVIQFETNKEAIGQSKIDIRPARARPSDVELICRPSVATDSVQSWSLVRRWIDTCLQTHEACNKTQGDHFLPTRLIDVGTGEGDIRLCLSSTLEPDAIYLTLSHCWGNIKLETLNCLNISTMLEHIPQRVLSKTFKEAIVITRTLGFRYLWIDSLCILQDHLFDWQEEAAAMGKVYRGSFLNIAASDAPDGNNGCFFKRSADATHGCQIVVQPPNQEKEVWNCMPANYFSDRVRLCEVAKRAWVFQEVFLAPRTVYFGRSELTWECRANSASETFPRTIDADRLTNPGMLAMLEEFIGSRRNLIYRWLAIIGIYSAGKLSVNTDKLVALSGVSAIFGSMSDFTYLAGLWREDLEHQLIWKANGGRKPRPDIYQAPSWSWASLQGAAIHVPTLTCIELYAVVEDAWTNLCASNIYGLVSYGEVRLRCIAPIPARTNVYKDGKFHLWIEKTRIITARAYPDTQPHELDTDIYLLLIALYHNGERIAEKLGRQIHGLVLRSSREGVFRRVGSFDVLDKGIRSFESAVVERGL